MYLTFNGACFLWKRNKIGEIRNIRKEFDKFDDEGGGITRLKSLFRAKGIFIYRRYLKKKRARFELVFHLPSISSFSPLHLLFSFLLYI